MGQALGSDGLPFVACGRGRRTLEVTTPTALLGVLPPAASPFLHTRALFPGRRPPPPASTKGAGHDPAQKRLCQHALQLLANTLTVLSWTARDQRHLPGPSPGVPWATPWAAHYPFSLGGRGRRTLEVTTPTALLGVLPPAASLHASSNLRIGLNMATEKNKSLAGCPDRCSSMVTKCYKYIVGWMSKQMQLHGYIPRPNEPHIWSCKHALHLLQNMPARSNFDYQLPGTYLGQALVTTTTTSTTTTITTTSTTTISTTTAPPPPPPPPPPPQEPQQPQPP